MDEKRLVDGATALAEKQSRVIKIEPAERPQNVRLRVAAYTRVSSDSEDQLNSFAAQNRYYTELISGKAEWRMVDIYADEGISGTSVAKRDDFQRMMADCRRGLIDQILVKSISRFARNTKDCLQNIRELLRDWKVRYAPQSPDEPVHARFVEACHKLDETEYYLDILCAGDSHERAEVVQQQMADGKLDRLRQRLEKIHKEEIEDGYDTADVA